MAQTRSLLKHDPFRYQFSASALSMLGGALSQIAIAIGILSAGGSVAELGIVLAVFTVTQLGFILAGGVWSDRMSRRKIMMLADGTRVITQCTFGALFLSGHAPLWAIIILQVLNGAASALFLPASTGMVSETAPTGMRQEANALLSLTGNLTNTVGPLMAGGLVIALGAGWVLIIDGLTYLLSLMFLSRIRLQSRPRSKPARFLNEVAGGFKEALNHSWVWSTILFSMVYNVCFASLLVLGPATLVGEDAGAARWGLVVAFLGLGQVVGNGLALVWRPTRPLLAGRILMLAGAPILLLLSSPPPLPILCAGSLVCGLAVSFPDTTWDTALQDHVDPDALSRVLSLDYFGSYLLMPVGFSMAGVIASKIGTSETLLAAGALMLVATAASLVDKGVWRLQAVTSVSSAAASPQAKV